MADRIERIAEANAGTKALVEEGLRERYEADNKEIPQNFLDIVNTITALAVEYGVGNLSSKNKLIFDIYSGVQSTIATGVFNYSGDDPAPKAFAKAVASVIGGIAFGGLGLKGVTNVVGGYYSGDFLSTLVDKGYDIYYGPDYEMSHNKQSSSFNFTVDYTLADALLLPEKLKGFLRQKKVDTSWTLTDRNGQKLVYDHDTNQYLLKKTPFAKARDSRLIDGLFYFDNGMTPGHPLNVEFSDTSTLTLKPMSMFHDEMASLAKSDGRAMYALINLDTFYIDDPSAPFSDPSKYSDDFVYDRSRLLWLYNWEMKNAQEHYGELLYDPKTPPREYTVQNNLYFLDMSRGIEYGHQLDGVTSIIFGTAKEDTFGGSNEADRLYGMGGDDYIFGGDGADYVEGGKGNDRIRGGEGVDKLHGGEGDDIIHGGTLVVNDNENYRDFLYGEGGNDTLIGGGGDDILNGGADSDTLIGGTGYDTYRAGNGDMIYDEDGNGHVEFAGVILSGGREMEGSPGVYEGDGGIYTLDAANKVLTFTRGGESVEIHDFDKENNELGIELIDSDVTVGIDIYGPIALESDGVAKGALTISRTFDHDVTVRLYTQDGTATAGADYTGHEYGSGDYIEAIVAANTDYAEFSVELIDDNKRESNESFYVRVESIYETSGGKPVGFIMNSIQPFIIEDDDTYKPIMEDPDEDDSDDGDDSDDKPTIEGTDKNDILLGTNGDDVIDGKAGNDYIEGKGGNDILIGGMGDDVLWGGEGNDNLYGGGDNDTLYGDVGNDMLYGDTGDDLLYGGDGGDYLEGGDGTDYLNGGAGDDILFGGAGADTLEGGDGFDTYVVGDKDIITDSDNKGKIIFEGIDLTGYKKKNRDGRYEDDDFYYVPSGDILKVTTKNGSKSITINNYNRKTKEVLGIRLGPKDIEVCISDASEVEAAESMTFTVSLSRPLEDEEGLVVKVGGETLVFESGEQSKTFEYTWNDDKRSGPDKHFTLTPTIVNYHGYDGVEAKATCSGKGTIFDDDNDKRHDPLALDTNKDGFISTTNLENSGTYFDITGDGLRERVGWVKAEDGLLVYDKNENGQIDGIGEVFGSADENGFEELKRVADTNRDDKIDRLDELYGRLQVWHDSNQDAKVQVGELTSLQEEGIKSIDLNYVSTDIEIEGNLLTEAGKYTDTRGSKELAADIQLNTDAKDTKVDIADIPDFTVDESTNNLPKLNGSGLVYDSFILYNTDPEFKAVAKEMAGNIKRVATEFDRFIDSYSGYSAYINELQERYSVENVAMAPIDREAWIVERFEATNRLSQPIENYYEYYLNYGMVQLKPVTKDGSVTHKYNFIKGKIESTFAIQSVFKKEFGATHYDFDNEVFVIDDTQKFYADIADFFNSREHTIDEKLYLAKVMQMQHKGLTFDIDKVVYSIDDNIIKELAQYIFSGKDALLFQEDSAFTESGVISMSNGDELVTTADVENRVLLNGGDDRLISGSVNDTFYYKKGDGRDTIFDKGGFDRLVFDSSIKRDDVEIKLQRNGDLVIGIKEDGVAFEDLKDTVTMVDWMKPANRINVIEFGDGETLAFNDVFEQFEITDIADNIELGSNNDFIDAKGGNDRIKALGGNDTLIGGKGDDRLEGGVGNDTYIFSRGDGRDTVIDIGGHDTLQFTSEIAYDDLTAKFRGADLLIALKEDGKTFDELSDVVTLKNYKNTSNSIEAVYLDGYNRVNIESLLNAPTYDDDVINLANEGYTLDLLAGNDTAVTGSGEDIVDGNSGNDVIKTYDGDDTLIGGTGDDTLEGGKGNDTYIFNRGDGKDTIFDDYSFGYHNSLHESAGEDTLRFGAGISAEDIVTKYVGADLLIGIKEDGKSFEELSDVITIKNHQVLENTIEHIVFDDGTSLSIKSPLSYGATGGDDKLFFDKGDISIDTGYGHDFIHTAAGNDNIYGNRGNDDIHSGDGDDILYGGTGIDFLFGGAGNDTYLFNRGDGNNTIFDDNRDEYIADTNMYHGMYKTYPKIINSLTPQKDAGKDTLIFGEGITLDDIEVRISPKSLSSSERDIVIYIKENGSITDDAVTIRDYFDSRNKVENILLSDGTKIDIESMINQVTDGDDEVKYLSSNEDMTIDASDGNDFVATGLGNDTLIGGRGDDRLEGGGGDDTYIFNLGDGKDTIYDQDETRGGGSSKKQEKDGGDDTIKFGDGITLEDLSFRLIGDDLNIDIGGTGDQIVIEKFENGNNSIERLLFGDGTIANLKLAVIKSLGDNVIVPETEEIHQKNIYTFDVGDGVRTIIDTKAEDTLKFGEGVTSADLIAKFDGDDLIIAFQETDTGFSSLKDKIVLKNYKTDKIENIIFSDGSRVPLNTLLMKATSGDDILTAYENEVVRIDALAGNDIVTTSSSNDTLIGGKGDDTLSGQAGNDTYIFNRGDGQDTITDMLGNDILAFGKGIEADELIVIVNGDDLTIGIKEDGVDFENLNDKIIIKNYTGAIEKILFDDGTSTTLLDLLSRPTPDNDTLIYSSDEPIAVDALSGDDSVRTGAGDDTVLGNAGDDIIKTHAGGDALIGGTGDDVLDGGVGDDTYIFNRGDGKDTILDAKGVDSLVFGGTIVKDDLQFKQNGFDLLVALKEDGKTFNELGDTVIIKDWFKKENNIEAIQFADGTKMQADEIASLFLTNEADTLYSRPGAEMRGGKGDDTYVYKKDDFTVVINDSFYNKEIEVDAGKDILKFEDINKDQITLGIKGNDLIVKIDARHDTYTELKDYVVVKDWQNKNSGIEQIVFGDGEVLDIDKSAVYPEIEFDEEWIKGRYYIYGSENNSIVGSKSGETIESGAGDDTISTLSGSDRIVAGAGDDIIDGGFGNDIYVFNRGDGVDTVIDNGGVDTIKFGQNISRSDIVMEKSGTDLVVALKDGAKDISELSDRIVLNGWFNEKSIDNRVELMVFSDGSSVVIADLLITPTEYSDNLEYGDEDNRIDALGGDDVIHIGGGDDILKGNAGNDTLYGGRGDDLISGDEGADSLYGADGNDTYLFGRGDGKDTIAEDNFENWSQTGKDLLKFKDGVTPDDLIVIQKGDDLVVGIKEEGKTFEELSDTITIKKWALYDDSGSRDASRAYYAVEVFGFTDGSTWSMADIIANIGSDEGETIIGFNQDDTLEGREGDDLLKGHLGDDTYIFNRGDGKDVIYDYGRKGDDYGYYDAGNDTLKFGEGITEEDLIFSKSDTDIIIYLKDGGKKLTELSDRVVLKNWFTSNSRVENIVLYDGTAVDYVKYFGSVPTDGDDTLIYGFDDDIVDALGGDDAVLSIGGNNYINGNSGDDNIQTADGEDELIGGAGNDTLDGGAGNDTLDGGEGSDTYIFQLGDGHDTINEYSTQTSDSDKINFGENITIENLELIRKDNDLTVAIDDTNSIFIPNWFLEKGYRIESFVFADGTILDVNEIESRTVYYGNENANEMYITENAEKVFALAGDDTVYGNSGDDVVTAGDGNDTVYGAEGDDKLYGGQGDDTLSGGAGSDYLEGGSGSDTYVFNRGDGVDTVFDNDSGFFDEGYLEKGNQIGQDIIRFGDNIVPEDLIVQQDGNVLVIGIKEDGVDFQDLKDKLLIPDYYSISNKIELFEFKDGPVLTFGDILSLVSSGMVPGETIEGTPDADTLTGGDGNDTLIGHAGNDMLVGGKGDDTYIFNRGDGQDKIYDVEGTDTILFGDGITIDDIVIDYVYTEEDRKPVIALKEDTELSLLSYADSMTLELYVGGTYYSSIKTLKFADGSSYDIKEYFGYDWGYYPTPLVLDFNGNKVTSTKLHESNAYFDYDGDGLREHTAWMEKGDALLVADLNGDGIINDGSEQFGEYTKMPDGSFASNGYEALSQYDTNGDHIINYKDEAFGNLLLWQDDNLNGKTDAGELLNIQLSPVTAIYLDRENGVVFRQYQENGNIVLNETNYTTLDGKGVMRDVGFAIDIEDTITDNDTLSKKFYGEILSGGAGNDTYLYNSGDGKITIDDNGEGLDTLIFCEDISPNLLLVKWDRTSGDLIIGVRKDLNDKRSITEVTDLITIQGFFESYGSIETFQFSDGSSLDKEGLYDLLLNTKEEKALTARVFENDAGLIGAQYNDLLYGAQGEEELIGMSGDDFLRGLEGDDRLIGGEGNDVLDGGAGDDILYGDEGNDLYIYKKGDGKDLILDIYGNDTLVFGQGIGREDIIVTNQDNDTVITFQYDQHLPSSQRDRIVLENQLIDGFQVETVEFANGEVFGFNQIINRDPKVSEPISDVRLQDARTIGGSINANDEDGDVLTYSVTSQAEHGKVTVDENGEWSYKVEGKYIGADSAVITIEDGQGGSVTKTINFDVKVSAPTIETTTINLKEDNKVSDPISVYNPVGGALTYEILSSAENGSFSVDAEGNYSYTPNRDYNGSDSVTLKVTNEYGLGTTTTIALDIEAVNDAPVANEDSAATQENVTLVLKIDDLLANDTDVDKNDTMKLVDITAPANSGSVSFDASSGDIVFEPGSDFDHLAQGASKKVLLAYTIEDAAGAQSSSTIRLTVTGTNDAPVIENITPVVTHEDDPVVTGKIVATDADDGATLQFGTTAAVAGFTLSADGSYSFNPAESAYQSLAKDETKTITIPVTVTDEFGAQDTKDLTFTVIGTNDIPTVTVDTQAFTLQNIRNIDGTTIASDTDTNDTLSYSVTSQAEHGEVSIDENGNWHYEAEGSFNGEDSAVITIDDGNGGTVTQTLNFTVKGYLYEEGDLVIDDTSGDDTLVMNGINKDQLSFVTAGDDLLLKVKEKGTVTLKNYFVNIDAGVETVRTEQGDINLSKDVIDKATRHWWIGRFSANDGQDHLISGTDTFDSLRGNSGNDIIFGNSGYDFIFANAGDDLVAGGDSSDLIFGNEGDDNLYGDAGGDYINAGAGDDALMGGTGRDMLFGGSGDDWISGGSDDDVLSGHYGSDTYFFNKGDGKDIIREWSRSGSEDIDRILFAEGISKEDVSFVMDGGDLLVQYSESDVVRIKDTGGSRGEIERIELSDGTYITHDDMELIIQQINSYGAEKGMDHIDNREIKRNPDLMNIVTGAWHNDILP